MYVERAFALTPAAIISDAKVCRHSCGAIGSSGGSRDPDGTIAGYKGRNSLISPRKTIQSRKRDLRVGVGIKSQTSVAHDNPVHLRTAGTRTGSARSRLSVALGTAVSVETWSKAYAPFDAPGDGIYLLESLPRRPKQFLFF